VKIYFNIINLYVTKSSDNTFRSEILAENLGTLLLQSNHSMCHIVSYIHRLNNQKNISYTDFVFINMQRSTFFFHLSPPLIQILSFARCLRARPLCLPTSFYCPAKHTILFPSLLFEYVCDFLRDIITKDNTPRTPLHLPLNKPVHCRRTCCWLPYLFDYFCRHIHLHVRSIMTLLSVYKQNHF
jgi:hypothetical protein